MQPVYPKENLEYKERIRQDFLKKVRETKWEDAEAAERRRKKKEIQSQRPPAQSRTKSELRYMKKALWAFAICLLLQSCLVVSRPSNRGMKHGFNHGWKYKPYYKKRGWWRPIR